MVTHDQRIRQVLLSRILDIAADAIIAIDQNQRILFFSQEAEHTFGYDAAEVIGQTLELLLPSRVAATHIQNVHQFASTDVPSRPMTDRLQATGLRKDGSEFPVEVSIAKLMDEGEMILVAILRDISRRRHAEEALAESEERYRSIIAAMSEGIVMQDAHGRIITCNESAERMLGLSLDQMMGLTSFDPRWHAVHEDGSPTTGADHPMVVTRRTGEPQRNVVMGVHRADGTLVWMSVNTQPLFRPGENTPYSVVASFSDITDQKQWELALLESEARYRSLFENSIDGILLTAPTGDILAANPEACRLLGRTEAEICRAGRAGVVDQADPRLSAVIEERSRTGKFRGEITLVRGDGTRFPAEVSSAVFKDRQGNLRTSMIFRDITERIQVYNLLEQQVAERTCELEALLEVGRDVASTLTLDPLLSTILAQLKTVVDYAGAGIAILTNGVLEMVEYTGPIPRHKMVGIRIGLDRDTGYQRVVHGKEPVVIDDLWADASWLQAAWIGQDEEMIEYLRSLHSWLGVPLIAKGNLIGLLRIDHFKPAHFSQHHAQQALAFANHAAIAIENARLYEQAQWAATIEERQRLSRELHDSVSQALYGIVLGARTAATLVGRDPQAAANPIQYVLSLAETALAEMRALIFELRPDSLETEGLIAALSRHLDLMSARHGLMLDVALGEEPALPLNVKEALYRIAQEAMSNVTKHAHAQHVRLRLRSEPDGVTLDISDDGRGFDPLKPTVGHMGLQSMRERAERLKGTCLIQSSPGQGSTVRVHIPIDSG